MGVIDDSVKRESIIGNVRLELRLTVIPVLLGVKVPELEVELFEVGLQSVRPTFEGGEPVFDGRRSDHLRPRMGLAVELAVDVG